jgi:3D (Asp-Asp-Asp) domain-containing protein
MNKLFTLLLATLYIVAFSGTVVAKENPVKYKSSLDFEMLAMSLSNLDNIKFNNESRKSRATGRTSKKTKFRHSLRVRATAYNSLRGQTDSTPNIAAWGDRLKPGMKIIAVSRDLLKKYGLKRNTIVKIKGLPGTYRVADKMNKRFRKKIDIYMGKNRRKALRWGKRRVTILW